MIDTVETLIQAKDADAAEFRELVEKLGVPDRLENLVFDEGLRVQAANPDRVHDCIAVIDRLRALRRAS